MADYLMHVKGNLWAGYAEYGRGLQPMVPGRAADNGLGRDAPCIQAGAAYLSFFNQDNGFSLFCRIDGCLVASRSCPDDGDVTGKGFLFTGQGVCRGRLPSLILPGPVIRGNPFYPHLFLDCLFPGFFIPHPGQNVPGANLLSFMNKKLHKGSCLFCFYHGIQFPAFRFKKRGVRLKCQALFHINLCNLILFALVGCLEYQFHVLLPSKKGRLHLPAQPSLFIPSAFKYA